MSSNASLVHLADSLPVAAYVVALDDRDEVYANDLLRRLLHADGEIVRLAIHPADTEQVAAARERVYSGAEDVVRLNCRVSGDGQIWSPVELAERLIRSPDGAATRFALGVLTNLTVEHSLEQQLLDQREADMALIACDLHDGLLQEVIGAQMALEAVVATKSPQEIEAMRECLMIRTALGNAISEGRRLIDELRPLAIEELGFIDAIDYLAHGLASRFQLQVQLENRLEDVAITQHVANAAYRIIQEALTNVRRHAGVLQARVTLQNAAGNLVLEIADEGCGFDPQQVPEGHFGLAGMRTRVRLLGGQLQIQSQPGRGAVIRVQLPLSPQTVLLR